MKSVTAPGIDESVRLILLLLALMQSLAASQPVPAATAPADALDKLCTVSGRVLNSLTAEPLRKVSLRLVRAGTEAMWTGPQDLPADMTVSKDAYGDVSESDGSFRFENVEAGHYTLSGNRFGFLPSTYTAGSAAKAVAVLTLVPGQQVRDLALPLTPQAVISGKVVDDDGDPAGSSVIQVMAQKWAHGRRRYVPVVTCTADDIGNFRCADLSPGTYYVSSQVRGDSQDSMDRLVTAKPRVRLVKTYYPASPSLASATPVQVIAGQDVPGVNIRMVSSQTFHIRGKVSGIRTSSFVTLMKREEAGPMFMDGQPSAVKTNDTFDIANVSPGTYLLTILTPEQNFGIAGHQNVDVSTADVNNVVFTVINPGSLKGQILVEGIPPSSTVRPEFPSVRISLEPSDQALTAAPSPPLEMREDGSFVLSRVFAGRYTVSASPLSGAYVKSIQYGSTEVLGKELDLSGGVGAELRVLYRYGSAQVEGKLKRLPETLTAWTSAEAKIVLVPDILNADGSGFHFSKTDSEGTFSIQDLSPGHYRIYAFEQVDFEQIENPELLKLIAERGLAVELKEGEKKQVEPPLISFSDLSQIIMRAGLTQ